VDTQKCKDHFFQEEEEEQEEEQEQEQEEAPGLSELVQAISTS